METVFLAGRAGTGKSRYIYDRIAENEAAGMRSMLIVPDRATFEVERALSERLGYGMIHTSVLSFTSLARKVHSETGDGRTLLTIQGRQMLVRRAVEDNASSLSAFARVARHMGFSAECDEMILRCKRFSLLPDTLLSACSALPARLADKMRDLALIYQSVSQNMADKYIDGEDLVNSLVERLPFSSFCGAEVFIDSPDSLNERAMRIISTLIDIARRVTVTLRLDTSEVCRDRRLFKPDADAYVRLRGITQQKGVDCKFITFNEQHRITDAALMFLEHEIFAFPHRIYSGEAANIELHTAGDRLHEVIAAAEEVRRAAKNGMRYRDMAVILGDPDGYANLIKRVFRAFEIPYFMDSKRPVSAHPTAELLLSALRCVERGFRRSDLLRILKTGLAGVSDDDAERFENFVLKYGLNGKKLTEAFTYERFPAERAAWRKAELNKDNTNDAPDLLERLEAVRQAAVEPLLELRERLEASDEALHRVEAIFLYMERMELAKQLKAHCERLALEGKPDAARENAQVYDTIVELLDQLHMILGNDRIGLKKLCSIFEEGLRAYSVGIIPSTLDRVFIGDIDKSSVQDCRFLQVLGASDGVLPKTKPDVSIINDAELAHLSRLGLTVWESVESMNKRENLRVYSALCMARERLRISYCMEKRDEEVTTPSPLIGRIAAIFPRCKRTNGITDAAHGSTDAAAFRELTDSLRSMTAAGEMREDESLYSLYSHFAASPEYAPALLMLEEAFFSDNSPAPLGREAALALYGSHVAGSATKLETFNECPFQYYLKFGLSLDERPELAERGMDRGILVHNALELLLRRLIDSGAEFSRLTDEDVRSTVYGFLPELIAGHNNGIYLSSARFRRQLRSEVNMLCAVGSVLVRQIAGGQFRPIGSELGFGRIGDLLPPLEITSENGARFLLRGIVDRLDAFSGIEGERIRIIDYKTGAKQFDWTALANGLDLQLPLYALAMERGIASLPKGLLTLRSEFMPLRGEPEPLRDGYASLSNLLTARFIDPLAGNDIEAKTEAETRAYAEALPDAARRISTAGIYYMHVHMPNLDENTPEALEKKLLKELRLSGLTLKDEEVLMASDNGLAGRSELIKGLQCSKKSGYDSSIAVATHEQMGMTLEYARKAAGGTFDSIMRGRAEISPAKHSGLACDKCRYQSICRFDPSAGNRPRVLRKVTAERFFER